MGTEFGLSMEGAPYMPDENQAFMFGENVVKGNRLKRSTVPVKNSEKVSYFIHS